MVECVHTRKLVGLMGNYRKNQRRLERALKRRKKRREHLEEWQGRPSKAHFTPISTDGLPPAAGFNREAFVRGPAVRVFKLVDKGSAGFDRQAWGRFSDGTTTEGEQPKLD